MLQLSPPANCPHLCQFGCPVLPPVTLPCHSAALHLVSQLGTPCHQQEEDEEGQMEGVGEIGRGCGIQGSQNSKDAGWGGGEDRWVWGVEIEVDVAGQEKCEVLAEQLQLMQNC